MPDNNFATIKSNNKGMFVALATCSALFVLSFSLITTHTPSFIYIEAHMA